MSEADRKSWLLIGVLFLTNFFVIGCSSAITGVFLTPLGDCAHHRGPGQIRSARADWSAHANRYRLIL